jgi:hypothetical protein
MAFTKTIDEINLLKIELSPDHDGFSSENMFITHTIETSERNCENILIVF